MKLIKLTEEEFTYLNDFLGGKFCEECFSEHPDYSIVANIRAKFNQLGGTL